jgi:hypothetical protein
MPVLSPGVYNMIYGTSLLLLPPSVTALLSAAVSRQRCYRLPPPFVAALLLLLPDFCGSAIIAALTVLWRRCYIC